MLSEWGENVGLSDIPECLSVLSLSLLFVGKCREMSGNVGKNERHECLSELVLYLFLSGMSGKNAFFILYILQYIRVYISTLCIYILIQC